MTIRGKDYRLVPVDRSSPFFNLELLRKVATKGGYEEKLVAEAYGVTLESAVRRITSYRVNKEDTELGLVEYVEKFKKEINELLQEIERAPQQAQA